MFAYTHYINRTNKNNHVCIMYITHTVVDLRFGSGTEYLHGTMLISYAIRCIIMSNVDHIVHTVV